MMLRPTISDSPTTRRARRISPTPPALLVGPSRLLRGDGTGDPRLKEVALSITLMWVACQTNRLHDAQAHIDRTPVHLLEGPFQDRILNIVRRSRHDDYGVIRSNNLFRVYFPDSAGVSFVSPIGASIHSLSACCKRRPAVPGRCSIKLSPRCNPKAGGCRIQGRTAMGRL